ncbi:MAG: hypothetical protein JWO32_165 [Bacteroidetes bacterium]|nr:hypothetical protein [Bacteroidota bacterium]
MKADLNIQQEIREELNREAAMVGSDIKILINNGEVILEGVADSYAKKIETERAARRVDGVKKVINNIVLKMSAIRSDADIKKTVLKVITWNSCIDENKIKVNVNNGVVTLEGEVDHDYQKSKAVFLTEDIVGVVSVINKIQVNPSFESAGRKLSA